MACTRPLVRIPIPGDNYRVVSLKGYIEHTGLYLSKKADKETQARNEKKIKEMLAALKVGDRVCTIGGIYGTITNIRDESTVTLAVGPQDVPVVFARWAIRNVEEITVENDTEVLA